MMRSLGKAAALDGQIDRLRRSAYLSSRGISPTGQFQLDLIFPNSMENRDDLRHIPND